MVDSESEWMWNRLEAQSREIEEARKQVAKLRELLDEADALVVKANAERNAAQDELRRLRASG